MHRSSRRMIGPTAATAALVASLVLAAVPAAVAGAGAGPGGAGGGGSGQNGPAGTVSLPGSRPTWANPANLATPASSADYLGFRVYLNWNNQSELDSLLAAQQNPRSRSFRQWLTPAQFLSRFGPTQAEVDAISRWLSASGLSVDYVPSNRHYVQAEGTIGRIESAFGIAENLYRVRGVQLASPAQDLSVPADLAPSIAGVIGLDQSAYFVHPDIADAPGPAPYSTPGPCSAYYGEKTSVSESEKPADHPDFSQLPSYYQTASDGGFPWVVCGYGPGQVQSAYGLTGAYSAGLNGAGVTVAVIDAYASPTALQDLTTFSADHNLPRPDLTQVTPPGTYNHPERGLFQDPQGWYMEESLDLDSVHSAAPGAKLLFVGAPNNFQDLDAAMNYIVATRAADIVSNSYGFPTELLPPGYILPYEQTLMQGAAEGITIAFSSGDSGDEQANVGYKTVDYPASSPWVVSVGGTSLLVGEGSGATDPGNSTQPTTATPSDGTYGASPFNGGRGETGWGTGFSAWNWPADPYFSCSGSTGTNTWCPAPPGGFFGGAGGGVSQIFPRPSWQTGVDGLPGTGGRAVPDVAMNADPNTGDLFGMTYTVSGKPTYLELRIGGTSLACPLFAGSLALAVQKAGTGLGQVDPILYEIAGSTDGSGAFHDVLSSWSGGNPTQAELRTVGTHTSLRTLDWDTSLRTGPAWDEVTGLGSVNGLTWVKAVVTAP